jgi:2-iminoacetate synthase
MSFLDVWKQQDFAAVGPQDRDPDARRRAARAASRPRARSTSTISRRCSRRRRSRSSRRWPRLSHRLTVERFGRTMQLYAPLYLSNVCANVCTYCGFSAQNRIRARC